MSSFKPRSVLIGIVATVTMDVLSTTALKLGLIAFLPPRLTGRWFASMARGQFSHGDIGQVPPINHEMGSPYQCITQLVSRLRAYLLLRLSSGNQPV